MKHWMLATMGMLLAAGMCSAQSVRIGGHGAYATGGNLWSAGAGYGAQIGVQFNDYVGLELSGTQFKDEEEDGHLTWNNTTLAVSLRLGFVLAERMGFYVGGGADYLLADAEHDISVCGETETTDYSVDPAPGYHGMGGMELKLVDWLSVFGEYRYTVYPTVTDTFEYTNGFEEETEGEYKFGLVRAGLNLVF